MALSNRAIARAALIVVLGFLASGALGFVRLLIVSRQFGTSEALDAFYAAQRIPELLFTLVAGGALGSSFIPVYTRLRQGDTAQAWRLTSTIMTLSASAALLLGLLVVAFAPALVSAVLLPGRSAETQALTTEMTRLMMITPVIFSLSGLMMGLLQSHGLFILPSLAISMNSLGIILGALFIAPTLPPDAGVAQVGLNNVYGLAIGAVLSAVLHLAVQVPGLVRIGARLRPDFRWRTPGVRTVILLMGPRVLGLAVVQINFMVNIILTSNMVEGSLVALTTAFQLMFFSLGIIGQSIGSAVFPTLSALAASADWQGFTDRLSHAVRALLVLAIPATVAYLALAVPIVALFEGGEWTAQSTQAAAWALIFYATGIVGFALLEVLSRAFYALEDTWTPVAIGIGAMVSNIALSLVFVRLIGDPASLARGPFAGLALANALTTLVEAVVLWVLLRRRIQRQSGVNLEEGAILNTGLRLAVAAGMMGVIIAPLASVLSTPPLVTLMLCGATGGAVYFALAALLGVQEALALPRTLLARWRG